MHEIDGARIERSGFHCNITAALAVTSQPIAMLPASLGCAPSISPPIYKVLSITGAGGERRCVKEPSWVYSFPPEMEAEKSPILSVSA